MIVGELALFAIVLLCVAAYMAIVFHIVREKNKEIQRLLALLRSQKGMSPHGQVRS